MQHPSDDPCHSNFVSKRVSKHVHCCFLTMFSHLLSLGMVEEIRRRSKRVAVSVVRLRCLEISKLVRTVAAL